MSDNQLRSFIINAFAEDTGDGDHSSLASIPDTAAGRARLIVKRKRHRAPGFRVAREVFSIADPSLQAEILLRDGDRVHDYGDIALTVSGKAQSILRSERIGA